MNARHSREIAQTCKLKPACLSLRAALTLYIHSGVQYAYVEVVHVMFLIFVCSGMRSRRRAVHQAGGCI